MYALKTAGVLRVSAEGETYGLDLHEHGISAYPEYVISSMGRPAGMVTRDLPKSSAEPAAQFSVMEPMV
jgi:Amt family ammonium transporter